MNFRGANDFRNTRNYFNVNMPSYTISSYSTDSRKDEMKATYADELFLSKLPMVPDPLKKNLADTLITADSQRKIKTKTLLEDNIISSSVTIEKVTENMNGSNDSYPFSGITNFLSGVFSVLTSAMFHRRAKSPVSTHNDHEAAPSPGDWQESRTADQNIIQRAQDQNPAMYGLNNKTNSKAAVFSCENKINEVKLLLNKKPVQAASKLRQRRPKRQFVDAGVAKEVCVESFTPDDVECVPTEENLECLSPCCYHNAELTESFSPKMLTYIAPVEECMEIVKTLPKCKDTEEEETQNVKPKPVSTNITETPEAEINRPIVSSCEDKITKLKALLQERRKGNSKLSDTNHEVCTGKEINHKKEFPKSDPKEIIHDKHFKNPHRTVNKRVKTNMRRNIQDDINFANEIDSEGISSVENSPSTVTESPHKGEYFDEISGCFVPSSTTESDDSFQIVFNDEPIPARTHKFSDCDSEDSFVVFEDSPDSCYTTTDVFCDNPSDIDSDVSDSDSDSDLSDSGCPRMTCKLSPFLSRTISDLTDNSLYEDIPKCDNDEVDCAFTSATELTIPDAEPKVERKGVLLLGDAKSKKSDQPAKKVHFSTQPPKVHVLRVWAFAARQARVGDWEQQARDRDRFKRRIADVEMAISWVLKPQHRSRVIFQRFMPWWNAERRRELAAKKQKEIEDKALLELELSKQNNEVEETTAKDEIKEESIDTYDDNGTVGDKESKKEDIVPAPETEEIVDEFNSSKTATDNLDVDAIETQGANQILSVIEAKTDKANNLDSIENNTHEFHDMTDAIKGPNKVNVNSNITNGGDCESINYAAEFKSNELIGNSEHVDGLCEKLANVKMSCVSMNSFGT